MINDYIRAIDANALLDKAWYAENGFGWEKVVSLNDIMTAPTINAVEVIYCKYCKYGEESRLPNTEIWCRKREIFTTVNYFCADGKKKEEKDETD